MRLAETVDSSGALADWLHFLTDGAVHLDAGTGWRVTEDDGRRHLHESEALAWFRAFLHRHTEGDPRLLSVRRAADDAHLLQGALWLLAGMPGVFTPETRPEAAPGRPPLRLVSA